MLLHPAGTVVSKGPSAVMMETPWMAMDAAPSARSKMDIFVKMSPRYVSWPVETVVSSRSLKKNVTTGIASRVMGARRAAGPKGVATESSSVKRNATMEIPSTVMDARPVAR